jgi:hypothetical protein
VIPAGADEEGVRGADAWFLHTPVGDVFVEQFAALEAVVELPRPGPTPVPANSCQRSRTRAHLHKPTLRMRHPPTPHLTRHQLTTLKITP